VNQAAVEMEMFGQKTRFLIHGHTHRMAIHSFQLDSKTAHRIVLGDWYKKGNYLLHENNKFDLISYPDEKILATLNAV